MTFNLADNPDRCDTSSLCFIASGGALFSPATKQRLVTLLPGCMILDDQRFGQRLTAVCQTRSGNALALALEDLQHFCRGKLAGYKIPRAVVCLDTIKRSPAGKADYPWSREAAMRALE